MRLNSSAFFRCRRLVRLSLALPMFPGLTEAEQQEIVRAVREAVGRHAPSGREELAAR